MRARVAITLRAAAIALTLGAASRAADREDIVIAPPIDATHPADPAAELPPNVIEACVDAGFAAGSTEHRQCCLELLAVLQTRHVPGLPLGAEPARLKRGFNLGQACARYFPSASRAAREEGVVSLLIYVGADGSVKDVVRLESTGYQRLDVATAQCLYREGRFTPERRDGVPAGSWQRMRYTWRLR